MKRREFFTKAGIGTAALAGVGTALRANSKADAQHDHGPISGPLANATVSFGAWTPLPETGTLNRFPNVGQGPGIPNNVHALFPHECTIKAGGTVNFIISGYHLVAVYDNGTTPDDIDKTLTRSPTITPPAPPLIDDPDGRVYYGTDPSVQFRLPGAAGTTPVVLQDRVEVVHFPNPGRYLVICAVLPHFEMGMYGYVRVIP